MPLPDKPLPSNIVMPQDEINKGETLWGLGDIDRGFQNMALEITALRAKVAELKRGLQVEIVYIASLREQRDAEKERAEAAEQKVAELTAENKRLIQTQFDAVAAVREETERQLAECQKLSYELDGVLADISYTGKCDTVCVATIKRVRAELAAKGEK
jgi:chromosome segregation ATPase